MIFVTVGTDDRSFDRLLIAIDEISDEFTHDFIVQIGYSDYEPRTVEWFRFTNRERIAELFRDADVVVCHAGAGTILEVLSRGKPAVIVPRLSKYGEHLDDHQLELAHVLGNRPGVFVVEDIEGLEAAIGASLDTDIVERQLQQSDLSDFLTAYLDQIG